MNMWRKNQRECEDKLEREQLYLRMQDIHRQLRDIRAMLGEMVQVVRTVADRDDIDPHRAMKCSRVSRRLTVLIVLVDAALEEIGEYCGIGVQGQSSK